MAAASNRSATATSTQYGIVYDADTPNERDHAFSGIMFDVRCRTLLPIAYVEIVAVHVRGDLGPMTVFATGDAGGHATCRWRQVYEGDHEPSPRALERLALASPIRIRAGHVVRVYVHSARRFSEGGGAPDSIVYASRTANVTHEDDHLTILPGIAHTSSEPFSNFGYWRGDAWRPHRAFVGRLEFGVRWLCWNPAADVHARFPRAFRAMARTLALCWNRRDGHLGRLPQSCLFYVLNLCAWHWAYPPDATWAAKVRPDAARARADAEADAAARVPSPQAHEIDAEAARDEDLASYVDRFGAVVMIPKSKVRPATMTPHRDDSDGGDDDDDDLGADVLVLDEEDALPAPPPGEAAPATPPPPPPP